MSATGQPPIYTKTGDDGTTGRLFGGLVSKADPVIEICGALDEAVAGLGLGRAALEDRGLRAIVLELQRGLFVAAAEIAGNPRARERLTPGISCVTAEMTASLERAIDALLAEHPLRPAFVVPGSRMSRRRCPADPGPPIGARALACRSTHPPTRRRSWP